MKRYKLGQRRTKTDAHGNSATMPDMIECENGEYIKYSECEQFLESIGAGGVSGRVTQPDQALLISMATRLRHDFGLLDKGDQVLILSDMRNLWAEVVGLGYYKPENRERYLSMFAGDGHIPDAGKMVDALGDSSELPTDYDALMLEHIFVCEERDYLRGLIEKQDADKVDAERYRWLRNESWSLEHHNNCLKPKVVSMQYSQAMVLAEGAIDEYVDAAIDAAIKAKA